MKSHDQEAGIGHGWGRTQREEEAQKIQKADPNEMAQRQGISEQTSACRPDPELDRERW